MKNPVFNSKCDPVFEPQRRLDSFFVPHSGIMNTTSFPMNVNVIAQ